LLDRVRQKYKAEVQRLRSALRRMTREPGIHDEDEQSS
jgi:hypothetical protein